MGAPSAAWETEEPQAPTRPEAEGNPTLTVTQPQQGALKEKSRTPSPQLPQEYAPAPTLCACATPHPSPRLDGSTVRG